MDFQIGDWVIHHTHGLGQVMGMEQREFMDSGKLDYYKVQAGSLTVWVPADGSIGQRMRAPASRDKFAELSTIFSDTATDLPLDRRQRNSELLEMLKDGTIDSLCRVLRDLSACRKIRTWNQNDTIVLKRSQKALATEWSFVFSIPVQDAEQEIRRLLTQNVK
jgi:RNA polymerase-interacting CarD/CdnL/TRCF family regulator